VNLNIEVSKTLTHWFLLLASFRFCETQYLHFTTRVFGHSAITPCLGGKSVILSVKPQTGRETICPSGRNAKNPIEKSKREMKPKN